MLWLHILSCPTSVFLELQGLFFFPVAFCLQRFSLIISIELEISTACSFRFIFLNWKHYSRSPPFLLPGWKSCPSSSWTFLHSHPEFLFSSYLGSGCFFASSLVSLNPCLHLTCALSEKEHTRVFIFWVLCKNIFILPHWYMVWLGIKF